MNMRVLVEAVLILVVGIGAVIEGIRLAWKMDPDALRDVLGPAYYIVFLGGAVIVTGIVHFLLNQRREITPEDLPSVGLKKRTVATIAAVAVYIFSLIVFGYGVATFVFFMLIFKIVGIKSWKTTVILSLALTAAYYVVFVHYCNIVFPRGIIIP